jgi:hypothetical protein
MTVKFGHQAENQDKCPASRGTFVAKKTDSSMQMNESVFYFTNARIEFWVYCTIALQ